MRIKPGAFFFIFRFVKSFDFEDEWACAIIAARNHEAVVIGLAVHNRAALKCGIDISADKFQASKLYVSCFEFQLLL